MRTTPTNPPQRPPEFRRGDLGAILRSLGVPILILSLAALAACWALSISTLAQRPALILSGDLALGASLTALALTIYRAGPRARRLAAGISDALRRDHDFYRAIIEDQTELICRFQPGGVLTFVNEAYCRHFCKPRDELLGLPFSPRIPRKDAARVERHLASLTPDHPVATIEHRAIVPGGDLRWMRWTNRALFDPQGRIVEYQSVGRDITDDIQIREALERSAASLEEANRELSFQQLAVDQAAIVVVTDPDGIITAINERVCGLTGYSRDELIGQNHRILNSGVHPRSFFEQMYATLLAGRVWRGEICNRAKNGSLYWVDTTITPFLEPGGKVSKFIAIRHDITARKAAAEKLRLSEERLELAVTGSNIGLWDRNLLTDEVYYSPHFRSMLGYASESDFPPRHDSFTSSLHHRDREAYDQALRAHLDSGAPFALEFRLRAASGVYRWMRGTGRALRDEDGRPVRMAGSISDITERKAAEANLELFTSDLFEVRGTMERQAIELAVKGEELTRAMEAAEAASRAKSEFLANMSHEIRTPMTAILGYSDLLLDPLQSAEDREDCVHTIHRNGEHLLTIINDILDLSKIEAGMMTVERIACDPWQVASDTAELLAARAKGKGLTLAIESVGAIPERINSDPTRLRQILLNLVGNALKFTETGGVRILLSMATPTDDPDPRLALEVADTGIGMTDEQVSRLFKPFSQADHSTTRKYGGTGLGLTISRRLAAILGGDLTLSSEPGRGSAFRVSIATGALEGVTMTSEMRSDRREHTHSADPRPPSPAAAPLQDARVLLAEDGPDNQRLITFHLRKAGAEVRIADNGALAVEIAQTAEAAGQPFDLILMDMQMPVMDGYTAASTLKAAHYPRPIIGLTAHAMAGDREKCLSAGCDDYLTKPINKELLINTCARFLHTNHRSAAA